MRIEKERIKALLCEAVDKESDTFFIEYTNYSDRPMISFGEFRETVDGVKIDKHIASVSLSYEETGDIDMDAGCIESIIKRFSAIEETVRGLE